MTSGLKDGTKSVSIVSSDGSLSSSPVAVSGSEISIPASDFLDGLDHGYFSVNATMDDASVKMSTTSVWCFVAPIISNSDNAALWQTYNVSWSVSPSIEATYKVEVREDSSNTNTIPADPSRKIEATVSASGLSITGLSSRTKYIAEVSIRTSDNFPYKLELPFETKSFAGNYIWNNQYYDGKPENGPENFSVTVSAGSDSGSFPYSVKINSDDQKDLELDVKGPAEVTAADIQGDSEVTVLNPDLHIATVADGAEVSICVTENELAVT